jgi:hypothetical protein
MDGMLVAGVLLVGTLVVRLEVRVGKMIETGVSVGVGETRGVRVTTFGT